MNQPLDVDLEQMLAVLPAFDLSVETLPEVRQFVGGGPLVSTAEVERSDHLINPDTGVQVRVHRPVGHVGPSPCVVSMHPGGMVMGDVSLDDDRLHQWVTELGWVAVSVGYRLAPEVPYPGPIDDCYDALRWVHERATELGVDAQQVGASGLSAGGGLAAGLALLARDRGEFPVAFLLLDSAMLDDRHLTQSSQREGLILWSRASNEFGWRSYLGSLYNADVPPYAAPARASDLVGLPPTYICVGTLDGFVDENIDFATRLNQAGVPAEIHVYAGAPHAFSAIPGPAVSARAQREQLEWLANRFATCDPAARS